MDISWISAHKGDTRDINLREIIVPRDFECKIWKYLTAQDILNAKVIMHKYNVTKMESVNQEKLVNEISR